MQRINIIHPQNKLARHKGAVWKDYAVEEGIAEGLTATLHRYANAIRDYAYFASLQGIEGSLARENRADLTDAFPLIGSMPGDSFNTEYRRLPDSSLIPVDPLRKRLKAIRWIPPHITYTESEHLRRIDNYFGGHPPEKVSPFVDKLARFIVAVAGGFSLIIPMIIMRVRGDLNWSLATACIAVLLFAGAISTMLHANNTETVVATAAYAVVLVVLVGTGSGG